jgi:hypothetical protein
VNTKKLSDTGIMENTHGVDARNLYNAGVVEVGEEKLEVSADTLIESPMDIVHCWYNESDADLRFMVIKAPKPKTKTVFVGE